MKYEPILKTALIRAIENTYDDSRFHIGRATESSCDFRNGLQNNKHDWIMKGDLLELIKTEADEVIVGIPGHEDSLVLNAQTYIYRDCINENQVIHTTAPEEYQRLVSKYNPHFDVYMKLDKEKKTISFLLGDKEKTLALIEHTDFVSKPVYKEMYCVTADDLERHIHDEFWNPRMITIGRHVLRIKSPV